MNAIQAPETTVICDGVLVVHRFDTPSSPGDWSRLEKAHIFECDAPDCSGTPERHENAVPCRWSWRLAHGKGFNGQPFPRRRCPGCEHVRRAGKPLEIAV